MLTNNVSGERKERNNMQKRKEKSLTYGLGLKGRKTKKKTLGRCKSEKLRNIQSSTLNDCNIT